MYQGYVDLDSNLAFSPFGYAALLAILAEGARGSTRDQLVNALRLPEDPQVTRTAYKTILQRFNVSNDIYMQ
jgi:serine protease inhibitor